MGKYILAFLGVLSLAWIAYVGINLTVSGDHLSPETVFGKEDTNIVIIHKPLEPDYQHASFSFLMRDPFYTNLLTHTERIQHYYFSSSRSVVLLERSKPWTIELADRYFQSLGLSVRVLSTRSFDLGNGWYARYDKAFLLLSKSADFTPAADSPVQWKYADRKSSASIVRLVNGKSSIENAYRFDASEIRYTARTSKSALPLADDQDVFQDIIPSRFSSLEFFEKNYLRSMGNSKHPLFDWTATGVLLIRNGTTVCIVTDCIPGQDPIAILGNYLDETSVSGDKKRGELRDFKLPKGLPSGSNWYIEVFNNRVFMAGNRSAIDDIIGSYETGNTLSQHTALRTRLFHRAPKLVSYRSVTANGQQATSLLEGTSLTVALNYATAEEQTASSENLPATVTVRIDGGIAHIIPVQGSDFLYVLSKENVVYGVSGNKEQWKISLSGPLIGEPTLNFSGNALIVTTASSIHQLLRNGQELNGSPLQLPESPVAGATSYNWKNSDQLAVLSRRQLRILHTNGSVKANIRLPDEPLPEPCVMRANAGEVTATYLTNGKSVELSIDRRRKARERALETGNFLPIKTAEGVSFYAIVSGALHFYPVQGAVQVSGRGYTAPLPVQQAGNHRYIPVAGSNRLTLLSESGAVVSTVQLSFSDIAGVAVGQLNTGKSVIAVLDGIANKIYIYELNGKPFTTKSFDGNAVIAMQRSSSGKLSLITQSNGYLVRYLIE